MNEKKFLTICSECSQVIINLFTNIYLKTDNPC